MGKDLLTERYIDPSIDRKREIFKSRFQLVEGVPVFTLIELNMLGACNRKCLFCPVSQPDFYEKNDKFGKISLELYQKILGDLELLNYQGLIHYSGLSEPLLLKNICEYVSLTKNVLPNALLEIITNGDVLSEKRMRKLFASGLDTLLISMYDGSDQIEKFTEMGRAAGATKEQLVLRRRYFQDGNYGLTISNRGGLVESKEFKDKDDSGNLTLPLQKGCFYPFYMLKINFDGKVTMCSHDWDSKLVLGNVNEQSIWEIWVGNELNSVRKSLSENSRRFPPCNECDVHGELLGSQHYDAWLVQ